LPEFVEGREEAEAAKAERLAPAVEAALARRKPPRDAPPGYRIDEPAELERARRSRRERSRNLGKAVAGVRAEVEGEARRRGQAVLARLIDGLSDEQIERRFGNRIAQQGLFSAMARSFQPRYAFGFEGEIEYRLTPAANGGEPSVWTIEVKDGSATLHRGAAREPAVTVRTPTADFMRMASGANPGAVLMEGRTELEGDVSVAMRLVEMFGGPSPY
jgi:hypothetical protein